MKKKTITHKGAATEKPKMVPALDSRNWMSESSVGSVSLRAAADPLPSPSDDPCRDCHVDFYEQEVILEWADAPENTYQAAENVDTSSGGWMPDDWSLKILSDRGSSKSDDTTIDRDTGEVTFGNIGQTIEITAGVKRCRLCKSKMKAHIQKLVIVRDGKVDVTGKTITVFAGETVSLSGQVQPKETVATDWQWTVTGDIVKDFKVSNNNQDGHRVEYDTSAWMQQKFELHWVDGNPIGKEKHATLTANVAGRPQVAKTHVLVKKPWPTFDLVIKNTRIEFDNDTKQWEATTDATFIHGAHAMNGNTQWVQLGTYNTVYSSRYGDKKVRFRPKNNKAGLDSCRYPYSKKNPTVDDPTAGFNDALLKNEFRFKLTMWLMWKSPKPGIWVPLASRDWWFYGLLVPSENNPKKPVFDGAPDTGSNPVRYDPDYPEWIECLRPNP